MMFEMEEVSSIFAPKSVSKYKRCFIDLEGSLDTEQGCILQLACVLTDWDMNVLTASVEYFKTDMPIDPKERAVHKITDDMLDKYATRMFHELGEDTLLNAEDTMFISYSTFDIKRITEETVKRGVPPYSFGEEVDSLASPVAKENVHFNAFSLGKSRLSSHIATLTQKDIDNLFYEVKDYVSIVELRPHEALFDVLVTLDLCRKRYRL